MVSFFEKIGYKKHYTTLNLAFNYKNIQIKQQAPVVQRLDSESIG